ncbi:MAG: protein phosphatase 2C domain-containing protein [Deltaproteobacteria bacterium]|nr:protein phosphatase 2C domain-containing protein [Deltaproteobacteria bacterium]
MNRSFSISGGSVTGRHHVRAGHNNQDAFAWRTTASASLITAVCDGCSSGSHSEVGARLGSALLVQAVAQELGEASPLEIVERTQRRVLEELARIARAMCEEDPEQEALRRTVEETFLFTVVGVVLREDRAFAFTLGDGLLAVNGKVERLGPFPGNAPPYLGYGLCEPDSGRWSLETRLLPSPTEIESLVIATDGAAGLDLAPFVTDPRVVANPDMVRRLLWQQARARNLDDDATLVVIRRAAGEGTP